MTMKTPQWEPGEPSLAHERHCGSGDVRGSSRDDSRIWPQGLRGGQEGHGRDGVAWNAGCRVEHKQDIA